jgi:hypothetical protein
VPARLATLAALSAIALAACTAAERATEPLTPPALSIASTDVCDGTGVTVAECEALVALYNSTDGDNWSPYNTNWGANTNPCTWENVICPDNGDTGPVRAIIFLGGNHMSGTLPAELGDLFGLTGILFQFNPALTGPIPPELGNLPELQALHLDGNALTGPVPASLGNLSDLRILRLRDNELTGTIPPELGALANLEQLELQNNALTGVVPLSVAVLANGVVTCDLSGNAGLFMPDIEAYRDADQDGDGSICGLELANAEDIGDDAADSIDELVPDPLTGGQANALSSKIENALAKAAKGNYQAAINQMQSFITQLEDMVGNETLAPAEAAPLLAQAQGLIDIWTEEL